jgi:uncharacterized protein
MLEIRPICENCKKSLPNESNDARICTFECTFCKDCVDLVLCNVCPNCGGGFEKRPSRPKVLLEKYPVSTKAITKIIDNDDFLFKLEMYKNIQPNNR